MKPGMVDREVTGCYYCVPVEEEEPISTTKARSNAESAAECFLTNRKSDAPILYDDISAIVKQWKCKRNKKRKRIHPIGDQWVYSDTFGLVWSLAGFWSVSVVSPKYPNMTNMLMLYVRANAHTTNTQQATNHFPITSIAFNIGFASERHRDAETRDPLL